MSTARRIIEDYSVTEIQENENTLITDYWLSFIAARDDRGKQPVETVPNQELQLMISDFCRRLEAVTENQTKLHRAMKDKIASGRQEFRATALELKTRFGRGKSASRSAMDAKRTRKDRGNTEPGLERRGKSQFADRLRNSGWLEILSGRA